MAHPTRGHRSHTYDIVAVHEVDLDALSISYTDAAHAAPQVMRLRASATPAARQILQGMADSISVHGDGMWESAFALKAHADRCSRLLEEMSIRGVVDLADSELTVGELRACIEPFDSGTKRTLNKLIARVLRKTNPNGSALAMALKNTTYMVKEASTELYDDAEADAIEHAARGVLSDAYTAQREVFTAMGYPTAGRSWLRLDADEIIAAAQERHPHLAGAPQPTSRASYLEQIDWALLNPEAFGIAPGRTKIIGATMQRIGEALYPPKHVLAAAAIVQCLAEQTGLNLSVILRTSPSDLVYTGEDTAMVSVAKARSHSEAALPVKTESMFSLGGLIELLVGLTRFARRYRRHALASDDGIPEIADRCYVEHRRDASKAEILSHQRLHQGWRAPAFDAHWPTDEIDLGQLGLRFNALRRKALERAIAIDPAGDVHGHTERTRIHYLANVLPEHTLASHAESAQDDMLDRALASFTPVADSTDPRAQELASFDDPVDVVVGVCSNGGNDPDETTKPCSLGLAACFTCPNGFRTADNIPGLLATVELTEIIRDNDPDEWEFGDAGSLHFYVNESLAQFPSALVDRVRDTTDLTPYIVDLTSLYTELRR